MKVIIFQLKTSYRIVVSLSKKNTEFKLKFTTQFALAALMKKTTERL